MTHPVLSWTLPIAMCMLVLAMALALARMLKGPSAQDRVLALVLGIFYGSNTYFEGALLIALFSFVGTTAMAKFLLRGEVIE